MASAAALQLTRNYRRATVGLRAQTMRDLRRLWPQLQWARLEETFPAFLASVSLLVNRDRSRATGMAAAYVSAFRLMENVPGSPTLAVADPVPPVQLAAALHTTTVDSVKVSTLAGMAQQAAMDNAFVRASGAMTRLVLNAGRQTVMRSVLRDPRGVGWERVNSGGCNFCRMLVGRGAVYTEESVDFPAHDHCTCSAMPVYR